MATKNLIEIAEDLVVSLKQAHSPVLDRLNEGIVLNETLLKDMPENIPPEVNELYKWRNGISPQPGDLILNLTMFTTGIFLSCEKAISIQKELKDSQFGWDKDKFPLFESGYGDYLLIECNSSSEFYGMIYHHYLGSVDFDVIISKYDSLASLFETTIECFRNKIYAYDDDGEFFDDSRLEYKIGKEFNPRSKYWNLFE